MSGEFIRVGSSYSRQQTGIIEGDPKERSVVSTGEGDCSLLLE